MKLNLSDLGQDEKIDTNQALDKCKGGFLSETPGTERKVL